MARPPTEPAAGEGDGHVVSPLWTAWRAQVDLDEYDARFDGTEAHGEVDLIESYSPSSVLDAGCGTGRVAGELHRRQIEVVGVDLDDEMLERARRRIPGVEWVCADLATFHLGREFDLVALPGNVLVYCRPEVRAHVIRRCAAHLRAGGLLVAGFALSASGDVITLGEYDRACEESGCVLIDRWATWDRAPYTGGDYAVSVHRRRPDTPL